MVKLVGIKAGGLFDPLSMKVLFALEDPVEFLRTPEPEDLVEPTGLVRLAWAVELACVAELVETGVLEIFKLKDSAELRLFLVAEDEEV